MATRADQSQLVKLLEVTSTGKVIGKGAYGRVIEVYVHGTLCAAKEIHAILVEEVTFAECEATKQSFLTECVNASRIHHPNVVQVLGIHYPTPEAKLPWLVMEMMQCSVKSFMQSYKKGTIPLHFKLSILVDISQGLEFLHGQDIIHRDLSSNNVLLTKHCVAKIADLGVAKVIKHSKMRTQTQTPGTLHFMPPETLTSKPRYGKPVDVFSLGCVACHVMSHQWPEPKDLFPEPDSLTARTEIQRREDYLSSCSYSSLKQVVESCLKNVPEQRPPILVVCRELKDLKTSVDKQVPFATANSIELFDAVRLGKVEIARLTNTSQVGTLQGKVKKLTDELAVERNAVEAAQFQVETLEVKVKKLTDELTIERNAVEDTKNQLDGTLSELQYVRNDKHRLEQQMMSQVETLEGKIKKLTDELATERGAVKAAVRKTHVYEEVPGRHVTIGSMVECGGNPTHYGVIKWIGCLPGSTATVAGVELEVPIIDSVNNDGVFGGIRYYHCRPRYGCFLNVFVLRPDMRFSEPQGEKATKQPVNPLGPFDWDGTAEGENFIMAPVKVMDGVHTGLKKGIQGHHNSSYLDSTLYGLFAFSDAFDHLFMELIPNETGRLIKRALLMIVNKLRWKHVVPFDAVIVLRKELDKFQQEKGLESEEKDPEEFLNLLFKHILYVEPFMKIRRPSGTDGEFFIQLFVDPDENLIPSSQHLLWKMFKEQTITFKKQPLRLLLQLPRYGKQFKSFRGVIPSLELNIEPVCDGYVEAGSRDVGNDVGRLQLLSVICIETSHYVCFTKPGGSGADEWVFFDSMAERPDDIHNLPEVTNCTAELNEWVYGKKDLARCTLKDLPALVRRFVKDGYLYVYVNQEGIMYGDDGDMY